MVKLEQIKERIDEIEPTCICGTELDSSHLDYYGPHDGGWSVEDLGEEDEKTWLFLHCPSCQYDLALWKVGISRPEGEVKIWAR